ncbi:MAG TPA: protein-L-isoaspartate(D-aspartate) O-methyltransferase [Caldithrix sp.]|nr:protein-L-isoaspartate(D-aspartate) O-methyltransferase [Caldithrix sp.]
MKIFMICVLIFSCLLGCNQKRNGTMKERKTDFDKLRRAMVANQISRRGVKDQRVLEAMRTVPRHEFVPEYSRTKAYFDEPLPIGFGQTISQPYIVAYMTEQLELTGDERVLEIGTGSGYQAAVLAELADSVFTIEIVPELSQQAQQVLDRLGYRNIQFKIGDGYQGWEEKSPFDAIIVTAAPEEIPQPLIDQLKVGGRLIIPVGDYFQDLFLVRKTPTGVKKERKLPVRFVPMVGEAEKDQN